MYQLKRLRENFDVSRKLLSKITGIPYRTLQNWELGTREMTEYEYRNIEYRLSIVRTPGFTEGNHECSCRR